MVILMLIAAIILRAVASHTHWHFNPPLKEQGKPIASPAHNLTWKELLVYGTTVRLKIRLQAARSEKTGQLYLLDWTLPQVLAKRLNISHHLVLGVYNPLSTQNTSLTQTVAHTRCHFVIKVREHPAPLKTPIQSHERLPIPYTATSFLIPSIP